MQGGDGWDTLLGGSGNDKLLGEKDDDSLDGGAGNDTLDGGTNRDTMTGGTGDDLYMVDHQGDKIIESADKLGGKDTVQSSINFTLGDYVENLLLTGEEDRVGTGNRLDNTHDWQ